MDNSNRETVSAIAGDRREVLADAESFLDGRVTLHCGDCLDVLATLPENSVDSVVCDPPYHLTSIVKRFGAENAAPAKEGKTGAYKRASAGFMGKQWDGGDVAFQSDTWRAVLRVMKPGAHLVAFSGTRTYHRMVCAIEDAGFEVRDQIGWAFGSGFPKSHDVSKGIDKAAGVKGEFGERKPNIHSRGDHVLHEGWKRPWMDDPDAVNNSGREYLPGSDAAREWEGWGTALKPAWEPIVLARKPLSEGTVAANVLRWGTGALNIDGCRVETKAESFADTRTVKNNDVYGKFQPADYDGSKGRWPANVIHDGSEEVVGAFPDVHGAGSARDGGLGNPERKSGLFGLTNHETNGSRFGDDGSAARFFYSAKADSDDRLGSKHPTVKPVDLIQYLVRLVTPPKGVVLDCFAGTGTTGEAGYREGCSAILIEREPEYQADIRRRMGLVLAGPDERLHATIKAKGLTQDAGPLFGGTDETTRGGGQIQRTQEQVLRRSGRRTIGPIGLKW